MSEPVGPKSPLHLLRDLLARLSAVRIRPGASREPDPADRPDEEELSRGRLRAQVGVVRTAFGGEVTSATSANVRSSKDDSDTHYLLHPTRALVREEDLDEVFEFFDRERDRFGDDARRVDLRDLRRSRERRAERAEEVAPLPRLAALELPARTDDGDRVLATIDELETAVRPGVATPDHVVYVTVVGKLCPATEPEMVRTTRPWPAPSSDDTSGHGVRVAVVDTGLWTAAVGSKASPWMTDVYADSPDEEHVTSSAIHEYAGHGTFVSGVVKCVAPGTRVEVEGALPYGGAVFESELCQQLHEALVDGDHPQIISISAGTHTRNDFALLSFEMLAAEHGLDDGESTLVVAAAGNDSSSAPFWPAAFPWVVGVGSVDADGKVSSYSNYGSWVDVYARGSKHVNAFPVGTYTCVEPPNVGQVRTFKGLAQWSGTSFSTPIVSGLIAARMSAAGEDVLQARDAVLGAATLGGTDPGGSPVRVVGPLT